MIKGIGHVAFYVKDMEKTMAFYLNTLGFRKAFDCFSGVSRAT